MHHQFPFVLHGVGILETLVQLLARLINKIIPLIPSLWKSKSFSSFGLYFPLCPSAFSLLQRKGPQLPRKKKEKDQQFGGFAPRPTFSIRVFIIQQTREIPEKAFSVQDI